jgi:ribonuclease D
MIYLVTTNPALKTNDLYKVISVKESLELLKPLSIIGVDTETSGIDVHTKQLLLLQLGCFDFQVVIDCRTIDVLLYKEFLEDKTKLWLFWNAKFDLKFFLKYKIVMDNIYDGFLAEKLLWLGYQPGQHSMALKAAGYKYCNIELDKSVRGKIIWAKTLTNDIIQYGAEDVKYLEKIREGQLRELREKDLVTALAYENKFCPVLAYTEFCGVKLDENKWKAKMEKDSKLLEESVLALNA